MVGKSGMRISLPVAVELSRAYYSPAMSAAPPRQARRRPRRGSLERPISGRTYRGTWLLVALPLLLAAFTVTRPAPLPKPDLPPAFDTQGAHELATTLASSYPDRFPGTTGAAGAAAWLADQLTPYRFRTRRDRRAAFPRPLAARARCRGGHRPRRDRGSRSPAPPIRGGPVEVCKRDARRDGGRANPRAGKSAAAAAERPPPAARPRIPVELLRAGAVRRARRVGGDDQLGRRPASALIRRHEAPQRADGSDRPQRPAAARVARRWSRTRRRDLELRLPRHAHHPRLGDRARARGGLAPFPRRRGRPLRADAAAADPAPAGRPQ